MAFSYKKKYKNILHETKKFKIFYGYLTSKAIKFLLNKKRKKVNFINFLKLFESRLDVTLHRAKFGLNTREIAQLIYHNKVFVNEKPMKIKSYILKPGDVIKIKPKYDKLIKSNVLKSV
jgi:small subunit ribosomal protein S4